MDLLSENKGNKNNIPSQKREITNKKIDNIAKPLNVLKNELERPAHESNENNQSSKQIIIENKKKYSKESFQNGLNTFVLTKKEVKNLRVQLRKLKNSDTKYKLKRILTKGSKIFQKFVLFYLEECFIFHTFSRPIKFKKFLISHRTFLKRVIIDPSILNHHCFLNRNILKNFFDGAGKLLLDYFSDILRILELRSTVQG